MGWVMGCTCGTSFTERSKGEAARRLTAHRVAATTGTCVLCDQEFAATGTAEVRRPVECGTGHAHAACATDAAMDLATFHEGAA